MSEQQSDTPNTQPADEDTLAKANDLKNKGNEFFKQEKYAEATEWYTLAIELVPSAVFLSNRAICYLRTESFGLAQADAKLAIKLDPSYGKGYYRLGSAHMALGHFKEAQSVFVKLIKLAPNDKSARQKYNLCKKELKRIAFEKAIALDSAPPLAETLDPLTISIPASYEGPHLKEDGVFTREFVLAMIECFKNEKLIHKKYVIMLLIQAENILKELPSLVDISIPEKFADGQDGVINVCGDTHGQFYDVVNIFEINGYPSESNPYIFNGDFVDRGSFSVEVILTLLAFKVVYPKHMHLMRGNHETKFMNRCYGFEGEVKHKYDSTVMDLFTEVFNWLPLSSVINEKVIVMHGGLFQQDNVTLDQIRKIERNRESPDSGLMSDILWSDPQPFKGRGPSKRGVGQSFGPDITAQFLENNGLELIVRSHEVRQDGYLVEHDGKLVTVFSAPNYCDQMGNKGAVIRFNHKCEKSFVQFEAVPHPPVAPMAYASNMRMMGL